MSGLTTRNNVIPSEAKNLSSAETQERFLTPQTPFEMTNECFCAPWDVVSSQRSPRTASRSLNFVSVM
jgi:hypothetical protein